MVHLSGLKLKLQFRQNGLLRVFIFGKREDELSDAFGQPKPAYSKQNSLITSRVAHLHSAYFLRSN